MKTAKIPTIPTVENMLSRNGNVIPNQFLIRTPDGVFFQSYETIIAVVGDPNGQVTLDEERWDFSATTGKYRNRFLGETIKETRAKIASGEYALANLNA